MKQVIIFLVLLITGIRESQSQIKWTRDSSLPKEIAWNNYSTSFIEDTDNTGPFIVTAIPYNGIYSNFSNANSPFDVSFEGSLFRFKGSLPPNSLQLYTYDSSEVYFMTPGIFKNNAKDYEYRVTTGNDSILQNWTVITTFSDLQLNNFKRGFGFLGGYAATWGKGIKVELRKKNGAIISSATVGWKQTKPTIDAVYTNKTLDAFFSHMKQPWSSVTAPSASPDSLDINSNSDNIIFQVSSDIFQKEALEYQLERNGKVLRQWQANDYKQGFIWLKNLGPGEYDLKLRFAKQRHNVTSFHFRVKPVWHQTALFKIITGSLIAAFFGFILLLYRAAKNRKKLSALQEKRERLQLELNTLQTQLNPHFTFNCLSSIQWLINNNDFTSANAYLSEFSGLLRYLLTTGTNHFNTLSRETDAMEKYLRLEQLRFKFQFDIQVDKSIDASQTSFPSFLLQPLLENAVKHGIAGLDEKGIIRLLVNRSGNDMIVQITDNGKGIRNDRLFSGQGTMLTRQRITLLNKNLVGKCINWPMPENDTPGTIIVLEFKNWLTEHEDSSDR